MLEAFVCIPVGYCALLASERRKGSTCPEHEYRDSSRRRRRSQKSRMKKALVLPLFLPRKKEMANMKDVRATTWSVTINNPTARHEEDITLARQKGWRVEGQIEEAPTTGTKHYQLMVKTPQTRWNTVRKAFQGAHVEPARDVKALAKYVHKEDTKVGELASQSEQYPSLQKLWDMFADFTNNKQYQNLVGYDPDQKLVIFDKFIKECIDKDYVVETMAVNPQIRSCVKQYAENIIFRSLRRQTDRQTDKKNVVVIETNGTHGEERTTEESEDETETYWSSEDED